MDYALSIVSILVSLLSAIVAIAAFIKSGRTEDAQVELYINERITNTKEKVTEYGLQLAPLASNKSRSDTEQSIFESLEKAFNVAVENNLNVYEEACAKYRDKKVDKDRFRKQYNSEIRQLVDDSAYKRYFDGVQSKYRAILAVYKEWNDLEG